MKLDWNSPDAFRAVLLMNGLMALILLGLGSWAGACASFAMICGLLAYRGKW
jgi:hypothetical protein